MTNKIQINNCIALLVSVGLLTILSVCIKAAPGDLDATFGIGGKVMTQTGYPDQIYAVAMQREKIAAAGDFGLARYNPNGLLDLTFGYIAEKYTGVAVQPDGKIVTVGNYFNILGCPTSQVFIRRFNSDGSLDTSFGVNNGYTVYFPGCYIDSYGYALALQTDGKIVVAGAVESGTQYDFLALRLNSDGSFDSTFNLDGIATFPIGSSNDKAYAVAIQPSTGKIVLAGYSYNSATSNNFALVGLTFNGLYDLNFGSGGKITTDFVGSDDRANAVAFQADGKIIAAGQQSTASTGVDFALARYNSNGTLDPTFDGNGKAGTVFGSYSDIIYGISLQPNGKIVAAGRGRAAGDTSDNFAVARYNTNASLDTTFSGDGKLTTDFGGYNDYGRAVVFQPDGKIVVAGYASNGNDNDIALARYLP